MGLGLDKKVIGCCNEIWHWLKLMDWIKKKKKKLNYKKKKKNLKNYEIKLYLLKILKSNMILKYKRHISL
jgi:hypothetical protein